MRTALVNLAVLAALALALLLGAELWLRLTIPPSSGESIYLYTLATPRYKLMKPNATVTAWGKELSTNELGFRDAAVPPKQPGELRIVVLGDSFTVAAGVDRRDMWTGLVQQRLRKSFPQARVVNLAVGGYNVVQYRMVLEEVGLRLAPDLLLVGLFPDNDFSMATYEENLRVASGEPQAEPPWHQRLYVYRAYLGRLEARVTSLFSGKAKPAKAHSSGWDENAAALRAIADIARREKLPLAVALLPHTWHFERQRPLFARVGALCRELQLACIDLLEPFIARRLEEASLRLNALDAHPNEKYNAAAAAELAPHLERMAKEIKGMAPKAL
ncbi:MAG TPA: SGNH/GDSL hydrolase family protein [Burkholderiales bacterium]